MKSLNCSKPYQVFLLGKAYWIRCADDMHKFLDERNKVIDKMGVKEFKKKERYYAGRYREKST